jgi:Flp pilus assembly protein TadG
MKRMTKRGQTLIMTAIILPVFVGLVCGFAVDVGSVYFTHIRMQTGADAAVLAGAYCLPDPTLCSAVATTTNYAAINGIAAGEIISGPTIGTALLMGILMCR